MSLLFLQRAINAGSVRTEDKVNLTPFTLILYQSLYPCDMNDRQLSEASERLKLSHKSISEVSSITSLGVSLRLSASALVGAS
ncbi:unnamed protein product, partial [Nesidiocoris tenuis]